MYKYIVGIDVGGTKCAVIVGSVDRDNNITLLERYAFPTQGTPDVIISKIIDKINEFKKTYDIKSIGISCGGPLDRDKGLILSPPNLPGWDHIEICKIVTEATGVPSSLSNDADAGALAEWLYGAGKGTKNMIFLTFGTGMGAGLILDSRLYSGTNSMAGEVGHMRMEPTGPVGYGKEGSFEGFCSGGGIARYAQSVVIKKLQDGIKPSFCPDENTLSTITAHTVAIAAREGDTTAQEIFSTVGEYLGRGLSVLIDILNPQKIVIGSIFLRCEDLLREGMEKAIKREALSLSSNVCEIVPVGLGEQIGDYAALAVAQYFSNK